MPRDWHAVTQKALLALKKVLGHSGED